MLEKIIRILFFSKKLVRNSELGQSSQFRLASYRTIGPLSFAQITSPLTVLHRHRLTAAAAITRDRPTNSPLAKRRKDSSSSTTTTVAVLGEDILLENFLRLPCLATLVRAAFTCRGWRRAVASSPAFRRRFRQLHPAPLLGLLFNPPGPVQDPELPAFPSFVPTRGADRDQAAAVRGGDFFLTALQGRPGIHNGWDIHDCRGGYVLFANGDQETMAVVNPLARRSKRFFDFGHQDTLKVSAPTA
jgi:hypothetical protein